MCIIVPKNGTLKKGMNCMVTQEQRELFAKLKKVLKTKRITYRKIGEELGLAESSVKKIFAQENCSVDKLMQICSVVDISLRQLTDLYKTGLVPLVNIDAKVEQFFIDNPHYFSFFRQLSLYKSVDTVKQRNGLSSASVKKYIEKLKKFDLISKNSNRQYSVRREGFVKLVENGLLSQKLCELWSKDLLEKALLKKQDYSLSFGSTRLRPETALEFKNEIKNLVNRIKEQGYLESLAGDSNLEAFGICVLTGPQIVDFPNRLPNV